MRRYIRSLVVLATLLNAAAARGQTATFPAFDLWPSVADRSFFAVSSSQGLYQWQYAFDLSNQFILRSLDLLDPSGTRLRSVVDYAFGHFFSAGVGVFDFWQIGLTLPVFSIARFTEPLLDPSPGFSNVSEIGDLRISMKFRALDANRHRFGLAFEPFATIPLGGDNHYLGYDSVTGGARVIGDFLATSKVRLALNIGAEILGGNVLINNVDFGHRFLTGLGVSVAATRKITASAEFQANTAFKSFFSDKDTTPVEFLAGAQWDVGETGLKLGFGGGSCVVCGGRGAKGRGFVNISYRRMNESYGLKEKREENMRFVTLGEQAALEKEAFAIYELVEKCPIESKQYVAGRDDPRCMEVYELQGLAETCPDNREDFDPSRDNPRCFRIYALRRHDTDSDGIPDPKDQCPTEAGDRDNKGCPNRAFLIIDPEVNQILTQVIHFEFGKAILKDDAFPILNTLAGAIHSQPAIQMITIEGYTDDVGSDEANWNLSHARAKAVYDYLLDQGINPQRLRTLGYGERHPIADNDSEEHRAMNRRVEFKIDKVGSF